MELARELTDFLGAVEQRLGSTLVDGNAGPDVKGDTLMEAARHLCLGSGGKRARPMLARLFGDAVGVPGERLVDVAVAAELIHSASLLHDDVVDAGMFRRGRPTVNARWGNIVAVMSGDLILSTALSRLAELDARLVKSGLAVVSEMTRAAIAEVERWREEWLASAPAPVLALERRSGWRSSPAARVGGASAPRRRSGWWRRRCSLARR